MHRDTMLVCGGTRGGFDDAEVLHDVIALEIGEPGIQSMQEHAPPASAPRWEHLLSLGGSPTSPVEGRYNHACTVEENLPGHPLGAQAEAPCLLLVGGSDASHATVDDALAVVLGES